MARSDPGPFLADELRARFGGELVGATPGLSLERLAPIETARRGDLSFLAGARHRQAAARTEASLVIVSAALADALPAGCARLITPDPYATYAAVTRWLRARRGAGGARSSGVHPSASVDAQAHVDPTAWVGPGCVVEAGCVVGARAWLGPQVILGEGARIGADTRLEAHVVVYHDCEIGERCLIHAGTVVGADGFGFAPEQGRWSKIEQLGRAVIGNDVEIGANCCVDRGAIEDTVIGDGCKLDNLIQVGHNVRIGEHTAIAGCVGIAGSAVIGRHVMIGGGAGILGHLNICDRAVISAMSLVTRSVTEPGLHTGVFPLMPNAQWERAAVALKQLPRWRDRLRQLERSLERAPSNDSRDTP